MKIFRNAAVLVAILVMLFIACDDKTSTQSRDDLRGTVTISGAFAIYPVMTRWGEEFTKRHPDAEFDISGGGAGKGMTDVLSGAVDIGMVSRAVKPEEVSQGAYPIGVVKDAVFPVVNAANPVIADIMQKGIRKESYQKIFITGMIKTWGEVVGRPEITEKIHIYTRSDSAGAADVWAQYLGGKGQANLQGIGVNGDPGLLDAVAKDRLGIGYNNLGYAFDQATGKLPLGVKVVPMDAGRGGTVQGPEILDTLAKATDAVAGGRYPSPPARILYLVTKGKPSGLVRAFIRWILTDGQALVPESGYVQISSDLIAKSLERIK